MKLVSRLIATSMLTFALPSVSQAAAAEPAKQSMLDVIIAGGFLMIPILTASFLMTLVVFERLVSLRRGRVLPGPFVKCFLSQLREGSLDREEALDLCEENDSHVARVFAAGVRKWGKPAVEVEQAVLDEGERTANDLRRYLRVINGVATVSPLLGLLGTVWGMMESFNALSSANSAGKSEMLASGISQALVTTAAGLFVAIPAMILYLYFVGRVDRLVMDIDSRGQELVNLVSAEAAQLRNSATHRAMKKKAA
jgi:biopolymer transport protein ExbB